MQQSTLKSQMDALAAKVTQSAAALKNLTDQTTRIEAANRRHKLHASLGEADDKTFALVEGLIATYGEGSEIVADFVEHQGALTGQATTRQHKSTARLDELTRKLMSESGGTLTYGDAFSRVVRRNRALYEQHIQAVS